MVHRVVVRVPSQIPRRNSNRGCPDLVDCLLGCNRCSSFFCRATTRCARASIRLVWRSLNYAHRAKRASAMPANWMLQCVLQATAQRIPLWDAHTSASPSAGTRLSLAGLRRRLHVWHQARTDSSRDTSCACSTASKLLLWTKRTMASRTMSLGPVSQQAFWRADCVCPCFQLECTDCASWRTTPAETRSECADTSQA